MSDLSATPTAARTLSHSPRGLDAIVLPSITTEAVPTDEYHLRTKEGYIPSSVEDQTVTERGLERQASHRVPILPSPTSTTVHRGQEEKGAQEFKIVTFTDNDPDDPRQFSKTRKWLLTLLVSTDCFLAAFGSSVITMDLEDQAAALGCSLDVIHLTVTLFVVGFAVGPLFFSPLSEQFGRTPVLIVSMCSYWIFIFPSAFAHNAASMVVGRMLSGLGASAPVCLVAGSLADLWEDRDRGLPLALFSQTLLAAPSIGPIVGGYLSNAGWRWNYYLLIILVGLAALVNIFFLPETSAPRILKKRAARLRKETGDETYVTEAERRKLPLSNIIFNSLVLPLQLLATEPIIQLFTMYLSLVYGLLYLLFFAVPIIFMGIHGFSRGSTGLAFIPILLGMLSVMATVMVYQTKYYAKEHRKCDEKGLSMPPEARLPSVMICAPLLPCGLFLFAWTSRADVHWIAPMIGLFLFGFSMMGIYIGCNSYLTDAFSTVAASAMASKTLFSRLCGAAMPMFIDRFYNSAAGPRWASSVLAFVSVLMIPVPFVFFKMGAQIRASSKRST